MAPAVTYYGQSACSITLGSTTVLVDPYISDNPACDVSLAALVESEEPDAALVTHVAFDHIGDAATLATEYDVPVLTEPATGYVLEDGGVPEELVTTVLCGMTTTVGDVSIRSLEAHHASITEHDGQLLSGHPLSYVVTDGETGVYHTGDTSLFSDLELFGDLYDPDVLCIGVGQAYDAATELDERLTKHIAELSTDEAVTATEWIDPDYVLPMHYVGDERRDFVDALAASSADVEAAPLSVGETLEL